MAQQASKGLSEFHKKHLVHGDVKPKNQIGETLIDFGTSSKADEARYISIFGEQKEGTSEFLAPEMYIEAKDDLKKYFEFLFASYQIMKNTNPLKSKLKDYFDEVFIASGINSNLKTALKNKKLNNFLQTNSELSIALKNIVKLKAILYKMSKKKD